MQQRSVASPLLKILHTILYGTQYDNDQTSRASMQAREARLQLLMTLAFEPTANIREEGLVKHIDMALEPFFAVQTYLTTSDVTEKRQNLFKVAWSILDRKDARMGSHLRKASEENSEFTLLGFEDYSIGLLKILFLTLTTSNITKLNFPAFDENILLTGAWELILNSLSHFTYFNFCDMDINKLPKGGLLKILKTIPFWKVNELDFSCASLSELDDACWEVLNRLIRAPKLEKIFFHRTFFWKISDDRWNTFCDSVAKSNLDLLDITVNPLNYAHRDRLQILWKAVQKSPITSLSLCLAYSTDEEYFPVWKDMCAELADSKLKSMLLINSVDQEKELSREHLDLLRAALRQNFSILSMGVFTDNDIVAALKRNQDLETACTSARDLISRASTDNVMFRKNYAVMYGKLFAYCHQVRNETSPSAKQLSLEMEKLCSQLMWHFHHGLTAFQLAYTETLAFTKRDKIRALTAALTCYVDENNIFLLSNPKENVIIDGYLCASVDKMRALQQPLSPGARLALLQFTVLSAVQRSLPVVSRDGLFQSGIQQLYREVGKELAAISDLVKQAQGEVNELVQVKLDQLWKSASAMLNSRRLKSDALLLPLIAAVQDLVKKKQISFEASVSSLTVNKPADKQVAKIHQFN